MAALHFSNDMNGAVNYHIYNGFASAGLAGFERPTISHSIRIRRRDRRSRSWSSSRSPRGHMRSLEERYERLNEAFQEHRRLTSNPDTELVYWRERAEERRVLLGNAEKKAAYWRERCEQVESRFHKFQGHLSATWRFLSRRTQQEFVDIGFDRDDGEMMDTPPGGYRDLRNQNGPLNVD